ncbi:MAG TPA: alpha/beta hydrolase [Bacteroidota bacterium]|nr:alpha/beta hydrolase [Bacteroidota bacterium]
MPSIDINGTNLYYELHGSSGEPLVLVHGSWVDHHSWGAVAPKLAEKHRVLMYDRRGHTKSAQGARPPVMADHVSDFQNLMESLDIAPAHVVANSYGAIIALYLGSSRPSLFKSLVIHEPPLMTLLEGDASLRPQMEDLGRHTEAVCALVAAGRIEEGAELFVETMALGPGQWAKMPQRGRDLFISNARTFLAEQLDPVKFGIDLALLKTINFPVLLTNGTESPALFSRVIALLEKAIPGVQRKTYKGAGHVPQSSHPEEFVASVEEFVAGAGHPKR